MIRPLVILPSDPFGDQIGGIKTFVREFVRFAPEDFATDFVACSSDLTERPLYRHQRLEMEGRTVGYLPILATPDVHVRPLVPRSLRFALQTLIRRDARRVRGRILQFHHPGTPAAYLTSPAPKILVVHLDPSDIDRGQGESRWSTVPGLLHRYEDVSLPRMDRIFTVNADGAAFYRTRHPDVADRVTYLPTFVDQDTFAPLPEAERRAARQNLLTQLGRPSDGDDRLVLFVGRLERQKDPILLVDAIATASQRDPRLRAVVVGEGGARAEAERRAAAAGIADRIHWLGFQPRSRMRGLMNGADSLLLPSVFEGMPITVLEALACGLPVVATSVGGVPEVVHDGANGRLVTERSATALADALAWVLDQPREAFLTSALAAVAPYAPAAVLAPFYEAHRALAGARPTEA